MPIFSRLRRFLSPPAGPSGLAEIARSVTVLETCLTQQLFPFFVSDLPHPERNPFRDWETMSIPIQQYALRDVVLDQAFMALLHAGCPVPESACVPAPEAVRALQVRHADVIRCAPFKGLTASCVDHWPSNYYHWIAHTIPTLHVLSRTNRPIQIGRAHV